MDKILIGLNVPAIHKRYDVFVSQTTPIGTLTSVLANGVSQLSNGGYVISGKEMLTMKDPDMLLQPGRCLKEYGIEDGVQLILI